MSDSVIRVSVDAVRVFCRDLKQLHLKIGEPKFSDLEKLSEELKAAGHTRYLSKSSINDTVRGKRVTLPEWEWVRSYARVCRVYAERNSAPVVNKLPSEEYWHNRWSRQSRPASIRRRGRWPRHLTRTMIQKIDLTYRRVRELSLPRPPVTEVPMSTVLPPSRSRSSPSHGTRGVTTPSSAITALLCSTPPNAGTAWMQPNANTASRRAAGSAFC